MTENSIAICPHLALLRVSGNAVQKFLQGYLTCDCDQLHPDRLTPTALCNLKGRVIASGWATLAASPDAQTPDACLILGADTIHAVTKFLTPYARLFRATLTPIDAPSIGVCTTGAWSLDDNLALCTISNPDLANHSELLTALERWLLDQPFVVVTAAIAEKYLPQVLGLTGAKASNQAVDFNKGCYLGQEIVARAQFRGSVKRGLIPLSGDIDTTAETMAEDGAVVVGEPYAASECVVAWYPALGQGLGVGKLESPAA